MNPLSRENRDDLTLLTEMAVVVAFTAWVGVVWWAATEVFRAATTPWRR